MTEAKQDKTEQYLQLARDAFQQKDYDTATDHLISVLQIDSSNSDAFGIMGDVAFSKKDLDTAEGYYLRRVNLPLRATRLTRIWAYCIWSVANTRMQ